MKLGFTGTRKGLSLYQVNQLKLLLAELKPTRCIHGDCVGADAMFHDLVRECCPTADILIWPSDLETQRAFKKGDIVQLPAPPLTRNHMIVIDSDHMIACPGGTVEVLRSGTWSTIRDAKKWKKKLSIIYPSEQ